jgi:hypothetical protein
MRAGHHRVDGQAEGEQQKERNQVAGGRNQQGWRPARAQAAGKVGTAPTGRGDQSQAG